jgi:choline-sulfatase
MAEHVVLICSDQHSIFQTGCYGCNWVDTPNIDRIAAEGSRFENAYSNNPICVPSRAIMATGCYGHDIKSFDNATPYTGVPASYAGRCREQGIHTVSVGKQHFRSTHDDNGFSEEILPLHIKDGIGDIYSLLREPGYNKHKLGDNLRHTGEGQAPYYEFDKTVTQEGAAAIDRLAGEDGSWLLYVGYTFPHPPFKAPSETWPLYKDREVPLPHPYQAGFHEKVDYDRSFYGYDQSYSEEEIRTALRTYGAMCTFLDQQIGKLLAEIEKNNLAENTWVLYMSDHGEMLGEHGMWGKNCLYEPSARVPLILRGPGIPRGHVENSLCALVDIFPTVLDLLQVKETEEEKKNLPGRSLRRTIASPDPERVIYSEYFATGANTGEYMIRKGNWKYLYYVRQDPQLFNLAEDPYELHDLAENSSTLPIQKELEGELRKVADPEELYARVLEYWDAFLDAHGGKEEVKRKYKPVIFTPAPDIKKRG